jgi:predicted nuclease of restriction endonuclease-like (RecB) superfamily
MDNNETVIKSTEESFDQLAQSLRSMNDAFQQSAASAINKHVTSRNWLNGYYIVHYEQNGSDRAKYGEKLLQKLAERLKMKGYSYRDLRLYRQFFLTYKRMQSPIIGYILEGTQNWQSAIAKLDGAEIWQSLIAKLGSREIGQSPIVQSDIEVIVPADKLFNRLSYTHFVQLLPIEDPLERTFYEIECIKGVWSTRELKRQIDSGYFIRSGLSRDKKALQALANQGAVQQSLHETVKSPFVFEFLGLDAKDVVEESDLESALMDHLQDFMLELGNGFCFEKRQKRILIDEEYYYMDLLFYNRIARFGVILELKSHKLDYKDVAQLNMYLSYYRKNMMQPGDNPPVGILLCTAAGKEMVEYATTGIDENLFISQYQLRLPSKEELEKWLRNELKELR